MKPCHIEIMLMFEYVHTTRGGQSLVSLASHSRSTWATSETEIETCICTQNDGNPDKFYQSPPKAISQNSFFPELMDPSDHIKPMPKHTLAKRHRLPMKVSARDGRLITIKIIMIIADNIRASVRAYVQLD